MEALRHAGDKGYTPRKLARTHTAASVLEDVPAKLEDLCKLSIERGLQVFGLSAGHVHLAKVEHLLTEQPQDGDVVGAQDFTPLHHAACGVSTRSVDNTT